MMQELKALCFPGPVLVHHYDAIKPTDELEDDSDKMLSHIDSTIVDHRKPFYLDAYAAPNLGILVSYFCVGVVSRLTQTPVQYYLIEYLGASATQYSAYSTLHRLPWSTKVFYGMLSDGIPIAGYRRKPWLLIGWGGFILLNLILVQMFTPGINQTIFFVVGFTVCMVLADVCTDTLCVERARFESEPERGSLQSTGFIFRSFGRILGAVLGTYLYDNGSNWSFDISQIFLLDAIMPILCMGLVFWPLLEITTGNIIPTFCEQMDEVWRVLQLRAVWYPFMFIYVFNVMQIPNSAATNFLVYGLGFSDAQLGYLTITSAVVGCVAFISFKFLLFNTSWRKIYVMTILFNFLFSIAQILLILRINLLLGIPDIVFAVGDDAIIALMDGLHTMPIVIMYVMLCPNGAEGTTFALLTTMGSLAGTVASDLGTWLLDIWDVSNDTLSAGDFSGVLKLSILTTVLQTLPILLVGLLPDSREEHREEIDRGVTNWWGGFWMALIVVTSLVFTIGLNLIYLF